MDPNRSARRARSVAVTLASFLAWATGPALADGPPAARVTRYDIATRGDLVLQRLVAPALDGDVADWSKSLLGGLAAQVGDWVTRHLDARALAGVITEAFPVDGQPALAAVDRLVAECARALDVAKPLVHVRGLSQARAYSVEAGGRDHLVLTSGLLGLFEGRPEELRFVVGRELGHGKCGHGELRPKAYAVLAALRAVDGAIVPDRYQDVLPTLTLGRLLSWCRESEISADRAGLLCCREPKAAYGAIMRLQHGPRADSPWVDPEAAEFDPRPILEGFQEWQYRPFVRFLLDLKRQSLEHPYYQERLAALKAWADTGAPREILGRGASAGPPRLVEVARIRAYELAPRGSTVAPYVMVFDGDKRVLRTVTARKARESEWSGFQGSDKGVDQPRAMADGQPLFFEIWDDGYASDGLVGGFAVYPRAVDGRDDGTGGLVADYGVPIVWDWKEAGTVSRPGHAEVRVRFSRRGGVGEDATRPGEGTRR